MSKIVDSGWWEIGKMSKLQKSGAREEINLSPLTDLLLAPVRVTSYCNGNKRAAVILWKSQSPMLCSISFSPPKEGNLPIPSFAPMPKFKRSRYVMFVIHTVRHGTKNAETMFCTGFRISPETRCFSSKQKKSSSVNGLLPQKLRPPSSIRFTLKITMYDFVMHIFFLDTLSL